MYERAPAGGDTTARLPWQRDGTNAARRVLARQSYRGISKRETRRWGTAGRERDMRFVNAGISIVPIADDNQCSLGDIVNTVSKGFMGTAYFIEAADLVCLPPLNFVRSLTD